MIWTDAVSQLQAELSVATEQGVAVGIVVVAGIIGWQLLKRFMRG